MMDILFPKQKMYKTMVVIGERLAKRGLLSKRQLKTLEYAKIEVAANEKKIQDAIFKGMMDGLKNMEK